MWRLLSEHEQPRRVVRSADPLDGMIGDDGRVVAIDPPAGAVDVELVVEVVALAAMAHPVVEAGTLRVVVLAHVPLADVRGLVACILQAARVARQVVRVLGEVVQHLVPSSVASAEQRRTTRRAERRGDERVAEPRALGREAIQVRRAQPGEQRLLPHLALHDAKRIPPLVVGEDHQDVRRARRRCPGLRHRHGGGQDAAGEEQQEERRTQNVERRTSNARDSGESSRVHGGLQCRILRWRGRAGSRTATRGRWPRRRQAAGNAPGPDRRRSAAPARCRRRPDGSHVPAAALRCA